MSVQLNIDEMLECLSFYNHPKYGHFKAAIELFADHLADHVAKVMELDRTGPASFEGIGFAGTCAGFRPRSADQPVPEFLSYWDIETTEFLDLLNELEPDA